MACGMTAAGDGRRRHCGVRETPAQARRSVGKGGGGPEVRPGPLPPAGLVAKYTPSMAASEVTQPRSPAPANRSALQATGGAYLLSWHKATPMLSYS